MGLSKLFKKDYIVLNIPKNLTQFLLGVVLFYLAFGRINIPKLVLGCLAFLFCYSAVYPFNDLMDFEEDRRNGRESKALVRGVISKKDSISLLFLFLTLGIFFLSFMNQYFMILVSLVLLTNFFHSSNLLETRKNLYSVSLNMFVMQFFKYSSGWLALTPDLSSFPFFLILAFSGVYVFCYLIHKERIEVDIEWKKKVFLGVLGFLVFSSYSFSFFIYDLKLPILSLTLAGLAASLVFRRGGEIDFSLPQHVKSKAMILMSLFLVFSFASLMIPQVAEANRVLDEEVGEYRENFSESLPGSFTIEIKQLGNSTEFLRSSKSIRKKIEVWKTELVNETKD